MVKFSSSTSTASTDNDTADNDIISFPNSFTPAEELPTEPENEKGFVLINGNTWLPKPLHEARWKQQRKAARKND